ncbi:DUF6221 family protein [Streptantibioticus silvisoli]|uniref:DUF6221 family protein n=1 Tax=Streptantibioticus silvisoli TaxID=2705255 RepID=A0ABT6W4Y5_9ACTN|nr:DUF6221 family protein [Streptantibioticus silvisoli]MDI5965739.1 DUF6221 family protein [Streptantibioticus silvisoli]
MTDLAVWLETEFARREALARAAACKDDKCACGVWDAEEMDGEIRDARNSGTIANVYWRRYADHMAANDPADVLRRVAADRKMLAECVNVLNGWNSPNANTLAEDAIRLLAEGYGWTAAE